MDLTIVPKDDNVAVAEMVGDLNLACAAEVRTGLAAAVTDGHPRLVVDLSKVNLHRQLGPRSPDQRVEVRTPGRGDLRIAGPGEQARVVLKLTTLDRVLRPYDSVEDALDGF